jgi:hypothetical protein
MAEAKQQSKGRFGRWLDRRREAQRRGADITARAKAARKADADRAMSRGNMGGGEGGGPVVGGF